MTRCQQECHQEQTGLHQHNATGRGAVGPVTEVDTQKAGEHTAADRQPGHAIEAIREQVGRGTGRHQHGHHKNDAHRLQPGDGGKREHRQQQVMQQAGVDADRTGMSGIETKEEKIRNANPTGILLTRP